MPNIIAFLLLFVSLSLFTIQNSTAQLVPMDDIREEQLRIQQLFQGSVYSSLTNRPVWHSVYEKTMEQAVPGYGFWDQIHFSELYHVNGPLNVKFGIYEPTARITANSTLPYGDNNEAAWYGRGLNKELIGGVWMSSDYLTITFRPQLVTQQNIPFEIPRFIQRDEDGNLLYQAESVGSNIDAPFRFGNEPFSTFSYGFSSIRLHYEALEAGFSNEPLWWGGNIQYPLLLSNNAPGMQHFFIGTRSPISIPYVGNFEFKYIGAFPEDSAYFIWGEDEVEQDRFMNGINISFSPQFAPNFHLGFARAIHTYLDERGLTGSDFGLILDPFLLENFIDARGPLDLIKPRNHLNSLYAKWIWPESHFEIYGEFYREDFAWDSRDVMMEPRHNSGYALGFQKLHFARFAHFYKVNLEFTNMTPSYLQEVRRQDYYYTHPEIRQGHTHKGQLLGASIGPGSNSQFFSIDSYQDWGRFGIYFRRLADNNHFHFNFDRSLNRPEEFRRGFGDYWRNRTDLTIGVAGLYNFQNLIFRSDISWTKLFNYGRYDYGRFGGLNISNFTPYDVTNIQVQLSISYRI